MAKSARRNKAEGKLDRLVGRVVEEIGKLKGDRPRRAKGKAARGRGAKGKAARGRGAARSTKGRVKKRAR